MDGIEVTLTDMMQCREHRAALQNRLLQQWHTTVISFCMNIPGPVKTNVRIRNAFEKGLTCLQDSLRNDQIPVLEQILLHEKTGDECIMAVQASADSVKSLTTDIEESHPFGRLFDMDVLDSDGRKLSRPVFRKCLICGRQAQECARSRAHSTEEMQQKIQQMLDE